MHKKWTIQKRIICSSLTAVSNLQNKKKLIDLSGYKVFDEQKVLY